MFNGTNPLFVAKTFVWNQVLLQMTLNPFYEFEQTVLRESNRQMVRVQSLEVVHNRFPMNPDCYSHLILPRAEMNTWQSALKLSNATNVYM